MKQYFFSDYQQTISISREQEIISLDGLKEKKEYETFLKMAYDKADAIFDRRFLEDEITSRGKSNFEKIEGKEKELNELIQIIKDRIEENQNEAQKLAALTLGNAYFRLAWCREEMFMGSHKKYKQAASYFSSKAEIDEVDDEIDILLMLNKGKYFRNTARIGKRSLYEKTIEIFENVVNKVTTLSSLSLTPEKRIHIYLDALTNMGRAKRYFYDFEGATKIFAAIIEGLKEFVDEKIKDKLDDSNDEKAKALQEIISCVQYEEDERELRNILEGAGGNSNFIFYTEYIIQALIHIGIMQRKNRNYHIAIKIFELINDVDQIITGNNNNLNIDAQNNLGVCYRKIPGRHAEAEKIFEELSENGNKFAYLNLCKCNLMESGEKFDECFLELKQKCVEGSSMQLYLILGLFYQQKEDYQNAIKIFEKVYETNPYIVRGSIGLKALYNITQCLMKENKYAQARKILSNIRDILEKQKFDLDIMVEIDYGWCLMQEGNNKEALEAYKKLKDGIDNKKIITNQRNIMRILNNLAQCYIRTNKSQKARDILKEVLNKEQDNRWAKYLQAVSELYDIMKKDSATIQEYEEVYEKFTELVKLTPAKGLEESGWIITACLLFDKYNGKKDVDRRDKIKSKIIEKLKYLTEKITLKSLFYLAHFVKKYNEIYKNLSDENNNHEKESLYRCFCHIAVMEEKESEDVSGVKMKKGTFSELMEGPNLHHLERDTRAKVLAEILIMYENILDIKNQCRFIKKKENEELPVHYTKLETLKHLLKETGENQSKPKLRLWNTAYMNDTYEGGVFGELLDKCGNPSESQNVLETLEYYFSTTSQNVADSMVYITSFSQAENNFQMWSIYAELEKGCTIRFSDDFFDIRDSYIDPIEDLENNAYSLYRVQYYNGDEKADHISFERQLSNIWNCLKNIKEILDEKLGEVKANQMDLRIFNNALAEIRAFVADRLNEIRFLFKSKAYEYENELRLIRSSRFPRIDEENIDAPKLYIDVERDIDNLEVTLGKKIESEKAKNLSIWLNRTGKVRKVEIAGNEGRDTK